MNPQEMEGKKFGAVKVLKYMGKYSNQIYVFDCLCENCNRNYVYNYYTYHKFCTPCQKCRIAKSNKERVKGETNGR